MRRGAEARFVFEALLQGSDQRVRDLVLYQYGEALVLERDFKGAAERFAAVEPAAEAEAGLVARARLREIRPR